MVPASNRVMPRWVVWYVYNSQRRAVTPGRQSASNHASPILPLQGTESEARLLMRRRSILSRRLRPISPACLCAVGCSCHQRSVPAVSRANFHATNRRSGVPTNIFGELFTTPRDGKSLLPLSGSGHHFTVGNFMVQVPSVVVR